MNGTIAFYWRWYVISNATPRHTLTSLYAFHIIYSVLIFSYIHLNFLVQLSSPFSFDKMDIFDVIILCLGEIFKKSCHSMQTSWKL